MKPSEDPQYQHKPTPPQFVAVKAFIYRGSQIVGRMISHTFAKRTARALNKHNPNEKGI
jgi:hypothetical protein